jgi:undecaprenyl-diphosphatase
MDLLNTIVLGIVEGVTEFLPISSTAHLIITSKLLNIPQTDFQKLFEVFIQSGAILAVVFLYFQDLKGNFKILKSLFFSFLPTAVVGFFLYKIIKNIFFESMNLIVFSLFFVGILFVLVEILVSKKKIILKKKIEDIDIFQALIIGLAQSIAIVPGVSRAGAVILSMLILDYRRDQSAKYSFLLSIPTIFMASFYDLYKSKDILLTNLNQVGILIIGFFISFIFALISVKWLIGFLKKNSLIVFGIYRILLAIILLKFFVFVV